MKHWKVYLHDKVIYEGGTRTDCRRWIRYTFAGVSLREILEDGVRIK